MQPAGTDPRDPILPLKKPLEEPRPALGRIFMDRSTAIGSQCSREKDRILRLRQLEESDIQDREKRMNKLKKDMENADLSLAQRRKDYLKRRERLAEDYKKKRERATKHLEKEQKQQMARYVEYRAASKKSAQNELSKSLELSACLTGTEKIRRRESLSERKAHETQAGLVNSLRESELRYIAERRARSQRQEGLANRVAR
jgi:hypothetical protein